MADDGELDNRVRAPSAKAHGRALNRWKAYARVQHFIDQLDEPRWVDGDGNIDNEAIIQFFVHQFSLGPASYTPACHKNACAWAYNIVDKGRVAAIQPMVDKGYISRLPLINQKNVREVPTRELDG